MAAIILSVTLKGDLLQFCPYFGSGHRTLVFIRVIRVIRGQNLCMKRHSAQMLGCLNISGLEVALLLNFEEVIWNGRSATSTGAWLWPGFRRRSSAA
jgi:hypothetical protein